MGEVGDTRRPAARSFRARPHHAFQGRHGKNVEDLHVFRRRHTDRKLQVRRANISVKSDPALGGKVYLRAGHPRADGRI